MSSKEKCVGKNKEYELVAPDGGWGYMICIAATVIFISCTGFITSFGLIYTELVEEIGMDSTGTTLANGMCAMSTAVSSFLTGSLLKMMGTRQLCFICVLLFNGGLFAVAFVQTKLQFYIFFGLIQSFGFGALFNCTFAYLNDYFVKNRLFAMSVIQTVTAAVTMFLPQYVQFMRALYGTRGTIMMVVAVSLHAFIAVALMQPVEWHMKKVEKKPSGDELQVLLTKETDYDNVPTVKLTDLESLSAEDQKSEIEPKDAVKPSWIVKILKDLFDVPVIKTLLLTNVFWGMGLSVFADITYGLIMPQALYSYGWTEDSVALAITMAAMGDLVGRGFFILFSKWIKLGNQELYIIGLLISAVGKIGMLCSPNVIASLVFITILGVARCFIALFFSLVISELVEPEKFPVTLGYVVTLLGFINIGLGPVIGAIRDYSDSYNLVFWILIGITISSMVSWTGEIMYKRRKPQKNIKF